jgi:hypothetical protein
MSERTLRNPKTVTMDDIMNRLIAMEATSKDQAREQSKTVAAISTTLATIQQDQKLLIAANEDIKKEIQDVKQNYGDMNIDLQSTKKKITGISVTVDRLTQQVNQLRQDKIQQQIVITGFPANLTDSFMVDKVVLMANNAGLALKKSDIVKGYKINTKQSHKHIIKLATSKLKYEFLDARKGKSFFTDELGIQTCNRQQIYMQEDLTYQNQELYHYARKQLKACNFTHIWTEDGRIRARDQQMKKYTIYSHAAVDAFVSIHKSNKQDGEKGVPSDDEFE